MPMIDVYATEGTFARPHDLAHDLSAAVMRWEQVPDIALFRNNTAAFVHQLSTESVNGSHAAFIAYPDIAAGLILKALSAT